MPFNSESNRLSLISLRGSDGNTWQLAEDIIYFSPRYQAEIIASAGMVFDLATIPAVGRWIVSNDDYRVRRPAGIHDLLCIRRGAGFSRYYTSAEAALIFYDALLEEGMGKFKAWMMWAAVRVGGPQWA